jgi:hypothetical protein
MFDALGCRERLGGFFEDNVAGNAAAVERVETAIELPVSVDRGGVTELVATKSFDAHPEF